MLKVTTVLEVQGSVYLLCLSAASLALAFWRPIELARPPMLVAAISFFFSLDGMLKPT